MTEAQAIALATARTAELPSEVSDVALFRAYPFWDLQLFKDYNISLVPTQFNTEYTNSTESQKIAFVRVMNQAIAVPFDNVEELVTNFSNIGANDPELAAYLGL